MVVGWAGLGATFPLKQAKALPGRPAVRWTRCYARLTDHKACEAGVVSRYMGQENRRGEGELTRQPATWPDAALHTPEWSPKAPDECGRGEEASRVRSAHCQKEDGG